MAKGGEDMSMQSGGGSGYAAIDRGGKGGHREIPSKRGKRIGVAGREKNGERRGGGWSEPVERKT